MQWSLAWLATLCVLGWSGPLRRHQAEHTDHSVPSSSAVQTAFCKLVRRSPRLVRRGTPAVPAGRCVPCRVRPNQGWTPVSLRRVGPVNLCEYFLNSLALHVGSSERGLGELRSLEPLLFVRRAHRVRWRGSIGSGPRGEPR